MASAWIILGNQLFPPSVLKKADPSCRAVFMAEDHGLCTHFKYHKHKIILFLTSMRRFSQALKEEGFQVKYEALSKEKIPLSYEAKLQAFITAKKISKLVTFEIEDKFMEERLIRFCQSEGVELTIFSSPMFLTSREEFSQYLKGVKKPFMKTFYEQSRKRLQVLLDPQGGPVGGKWSFDTENRKKLAENTRPPSIPRIETSPELKEVMSLTQQLFSDHPGEAEHFWLPTSREEALVWLKDFIEQRLADFGDYEDAMTPKSDFVFHSVLSPVLNLGLITPQEVIDAALKAHKKKGIPLNSLEGFVRQILGWREFVRGIYQHFSEKEDESNFWDHQRRLGPEWYAGTTGIPILDEAIQKTTRLGYCHHIERLMVLGNFMLLCEVKPQEAHRWFMEMFVDSSDWVMGPNVYGMALYSDGGLFTTKPYFCGSNYFLKMGSFKRGPWCDVVDGLFWGFVKKHESFFLKNPRLSMMARSVKKLDPHRLKTILQLAEDFKEKVCR